MPHFAYIVRCSDGTLYCGYSRDVQRRVAAHNAGLGASYTRGRLPVRLVHWESFESQGDAMRREIRLKTWSRGRKEALIAGSEVAAATDATGGPEESRPSPQAGPVRCGPP